MTPLVSTTLLATFVAFAPPSGDAGEPSTRRDETRKAGAPAPAAPDAAAPASPASPAPDRVGPARDTAAQKVGADVVFSAANGEPSFAVESVSLTDVLQAAARDNLDIALRVVETKVSEANILQALGAFDVRLTAGVSGNLSRTVPRGSAFVFSTGSRQIAGYGGLQRKLETGGLVTFRFDMRRTLTDQPISFFNPALGSATLAQYVLQPTISITHPLLKGLGVRVNRAAIDRARLTTSQAQATEQQFTNQVLRDIVNAYWDLVFSHRDLANKQRALLLAKAQLERTQTQVDAGRLSRIELTAVEQSLATRENEVILAESTLLERSLTLRTLLGQDFADREVLGLVPVTEPMDFVPRVVDVREEVKTALAANPQVRQLELALASREIDELEAANARLPQLDLNASFSPQGRSVDAAGNAQNGTPPRQGSWGDAFRNFISDDIRSKGLFAEYTVQAGLDLTWDIQNRVAKAGYQRVQVQIRQAELNLQKTRQTVATEVVRAANTSRTAAKRIEINDLAVELAEKNLEAEEARFDVGRSTNYDVLLRINDLQTAETAALQARVDYLKAMTNLEAATGRITQTAGMTHRAPAPPSGPAGDRG